MDSPLPILSLSTAAVAGAAAVLPKLTARLALSRAKHRSLGGHSKMSRMVARLIPFYEFDINDFFGADGAPAAIATQRQDGFFRLATIYEERFAKGRQLTAEAAERARELLAERELATASEVRVVAWNAGDLDRAEDVVSEQGRKAGHVKRAREAVGGG